MGKSKIDWVKFGQCKTIKDFLEFAEESRPENEYQKALDKLKEYVWFDDCKEEIETLQKLVDMHKEAMKTE